MTPSKYIPIIAILMLCFFSCSSTKKLQTKTPFKIEEVYLKKGNLNTERDIIYITITSNSKNTELDSIFFKGKKAKLKLISKNLYSATFKKTPKKDIIMSNKPYAEYGNPVPEIPVKMPFEINPNECIISYNLKNETFYYKVLVLVKE